MSGSFPTWDTLRALEAEVATLRAQRDQVLALCDGWASSRHGIPVEAVRAAVKSGPRNLNLPNDSSSFAAVFGADPPAEPAPIPRAERRCPTYDPATDDCRCFMAPQRTETP